MNIKPQKPADRQKGTDRAGKPDEKKEDSDFLDNVVSKDKLSAKHGHLFRQMDRTERKINMTTHQWRFFRRFFRSRTLFLTLFCILVFSAYIIPGYVSAKTFQRQNQEPVIASATVNSKEKGVLKSSTLKIAIVHFNVQYKKPEANRKNLIELNRKAALMGADIIFNTEMAISGFSFRSRLDIMEFTETENGKTLTAMAKIAKEYGKYIGIALAERDDSTEIYYNSAFVVNPKGKQVCKYRKISAEKRWACPGDQNQNGTFDTPWGPMGVVICSDSYYGVIPRSMALKGINLLWVPANWPPGGLNPKDLWQARAMENGVFIAACNRTGKDRIMDCRTGSSYVFGPGGREYFSGSSAKSKIFIVEIPLDDNDKISGIHRQKILSSRKPSYYRSIYLHPYVEDFTNFYKLPKPGQLNVFCVVPENEHLNINRLDAIIRDTKRDIPSLFVLPKTPSDVLDPAFLVSLSSRYQIAICVALSRYNSVTDYVMATPDGLKKFTYEQGAEKGECPFQLLYYGPAAIAMIPFEVFKHPEISVAFSKLGCDLVVLSEDTLSMKKRLLSRIKTTAGIAVAISSKNGAAVYEIPNVHASWGEKSIEGPGYCKHKIDTNVTRKKLFNNRINFELLLRKKSVSP